MDAKNRRDADLAAEANHFRTEAMRQELESGERMPLVIDPVLATLSPGMQVSRPAFRKDDVQTSDGEKGVPSADVKGNPDDSAKAADV